MKKYFGTDGIRGRVNKDLTPILAFKVGYCLGNRNSKNAVIVGVDTRLSSDMLADALCSGLAASGTSFLKVGIVHTPLLSYLAKNLYYVKYGVMITASHNLYNDNGIKIFDSNGDKISAEEENRIEEFIETSDINSLQLVRGEQIGSKLIYKPTLFDRYIQYLNERMSPALVEKSKDIRVLIDCANGALIKTSKYLPNLNLTYINNKPNGRNINYKCGSTYIACLKDNFNPEEYDIGFAFDGDGDRIIGLTKGGRVLDGDSLLYLLATDFKKKGLLKNDEVVVTIMSNSGLIEALKYAGIAVKMTDVGDKYVLDELRKNGLSLGSENSGHIIFNDLLDNGDALLSLIMILNIVAENEKSLDELLEPLKIYPQKLLNLRIEDINKVLADKKFIDVIDSIKAELGDKYRINVRPSGTEPILRIMIECDSEEKIEEYFTKIKNVVGEIH